VAEDWRGLHNDELHNLYTSSNFIRVIKSRGMRWVGRVAPMKMMRNAYKMLVRKSEGKKPLGIPGHRWECNIIMDLREIGWEIVGWIHLAQDRDPWWALVNMVMNLQVL
jgi:hypothetical protein